MPDLDTGVIDLCRRTPRKWKSKTRTFRHMTSMAPNTVPRRTQDKRQTNCCASELSHSYEFNSTAHALRLRYGEWYTGLWLRPVCWPSRNGGFDAEKRSSMRASPIVDT